MSKRDSPVVNVGSEHFAYLVQFDTFGSRPRARVTSKPAIPHGYTVMTTAPSAEAALRSAMGMGGAEIRDVDIGTVSITRACRIEAGGDLDD